MNILVTIFFFGDRSSLTAFSRGHRNWIGTHACGRATENFTQLNLFHRSRSSLRFVLSVIYALVVYQIFERLLFFFSSSSLRMVGLDWDGIGLDWAGL